MMEKAIKQRLLGGLVLVAGAALFLPVLLDGSGAALTIPPMPAAPEVATVEEMAPRLDQKVMAADQEVDAAHAGRDAVSPEADGSSGAIAAGATGTDAGSDVAPDAAALAVGGAPASAPARPVTTVKPAPVVATPAASPASVAPLPAAKSPVPTPVPDKPVATAKAPGPEKVAATARPAAPTPARDAVAASPLPRVEKAAAGAWVVQVASVSSREKAQSLLQQLRRKGYPAVLSQHGGNWKVMVGPELSREVATTMKNRLNADGDLDVNGAWVQAYKP